ncbi:hypothetical protein FACS1894216_20270 [Synergistales bacterium]|nr:hypothetical protein FACS1894216_20270 [Synergistales bacterium]
MATITATETKNRFGKVLQQAIKEPVTIEKSGSPVAVLMSYEMFGHYQVIEDYYWGARARAVREQGGYLESAAVLDKIQKRLDDA